jgi:predicted GNAT family acetyltransferase
LNLSGRTRLPFSPSFSTHPQPLPGSPLTIGYTPNQETSVGWRIFSRKSAAPQEVITGRFEIERDGEIAYLEYTMAGNVLGLIHTEVPKKLRGQGLASSLAETALQYALKHNLMVDVICPSVRDYMSKHPEYTGLVLS